MRRWNGWGDESQDMELTASALKMIEGILGTAKGLPAANLKQAIADIPATRLPDHPLFTTDAETRLRHACGQSFPDLLDMRKGVFRNVPDGVALPQTSEQVQELLQWAIAKKVDVVPYGGGTSVVGHLSPETTKTPYISIAMTRMNKLMDIDETSQIATFGAGTNGPELEAQLAAKGFTLGHFPQSWELSTVGGWVVTRSSGQQSIRYGRIEQLFAGGTLETPKGQLIIPTFPASSAGPDLRELVLGSEGRLGILTEVKVRITRLPEVEQFHTIFMPDWDSAVAAVQKIAQHKIPLSMLRLSNTKETTSSLQLSVPAERLAKFERILKFLGVRENKCMLTFGLTGTKAQTSASRAQCWKILKAHGGVKFKDKALGDKWKEGRYKSPYLRGPLFDAGYAVDTFETAMDWSKLPGYMDEVEVNIEAALADQNVRIHAFTHLSHVYPQGSSAYTTYMFPCAETSEATLARWEIIKKIACETIVKHGGTISHQHGVGRDHAAYMEAEKGPLGMDILHNIFDHIDPSQRMNPGVLIPK